MHRNQTKQALANISGKSVSDISMRRLAPMFAKSVVARRDEDARYEREDRTPLPFVEHLRNKAASLLEKEAEETASHLPVSSVFDALQVTKRHDAGHDAGVRALKGMLETAWKADRTANITASSFLKYKDYFTSNFPKSAVVQVFDEIGAEGYAALPVSDLLRIAGRIHNQADFDHEVMQAGLTSKQPQHVKARNFILAAVNNEVGAPEDDDYGMDVADWLVERNKNEQGDEEKWREKNPAPKRSQVSRSKYEVTVGNIGRVHDGDSFSEAHAVFKEYVQMSSDGYGRASGEEVVIWEDGEPIDEFEGEGYGVEGGKRVSRRTKRISTRGPERGSRRPFGRKAQVKRPTFAQSLPFWGPLTGDPIEEIPATDAFITTKFDSFSVSFGGKHLGDVSEYEEAVDLIREEGNAQNRCPGVWLVSDHGKYEPVSGFEWGSSSAGGKDARKAQVKRPLRSRHRSLRQVVALSSQAENRLDGLGVVSVGGDLDLVLDNSPIMVGVVGYQWSNNSNSAAVWISQDRYGGSEQGALEEAYAELEDWDDARMSDEEREERWRIREEEGYDGMTEAYADFGFTTTAPELQQMIEGLGYTKEKFSGVTFEPPEAEDVEDDFAGRESLRKAQADEFDEFDDDEPEDDDAFITTKFDSFSVSFGGSSLGEVVEYDEAEDLIREEGTSQNWYPNVWLVSDHGNVEPVSGFEWGSSSAGGKDARKAQILEEFVEDPSLGGVDVTISLTDADRPAVEETKGLPSGYPQGEDAFIRDEQENAPGIEEFENMAASPVTPKKLVAQVAGWEKMDEFTRQYAEAAMWSSSDESDESGGEPMDNNYDFSDLADETVQQMTQDCDKFQQENEDLLEKAYGATGQDSSQAAYDFWLTRNGHGAGFWDGDWDTDEFDFGEVLTEAAEKFGAVDLYVGDDGKIYS